MVLAAAEAVSGQADVSQQGASLLPAVENLRASSATAAIAVARAAAANGVATSSDDHVEAVQDDTMRPVFYDHDAKPQPGPSQPWSWAGRPPAGLGPGHLLTGRARPSSSPPTRPSFTSNRMARRSRRPALPPPSSALPVGRPLLFPNRPAGLPPKERPPPSPKARSERSLNVSHGRGPTNLGRALPHRSACPSFRLARALVRRSLALPPELAEARAAGHPTLPPSPPVPLLSGKSRHPRARTSHTTQPAAGRRTRRRIGPSTSRRGTGPRPPTTTPTRNSPSWLGGSLQPRRRPFPAPADLRAGRRPDASLPVERRQTGRLQARVITGSAPLPG